MALRIFRGVVHMSRAISAFALGLIMLPSGFAGAATAPDLSRITLADDNKKASTQVFDWLKARGFDTSIVNGVIVYRTKGVPLNITVLQGKAELDRLVFLLAYTPKDEFTGKPELRELAGKLNNRQNLMQVKVNDDGELCLTASLTFVDELSAREFDYFVDLYTAVVGEYILTEEALRMLN
jgi:hypothetical protein